MDLQAHHTDVRALDAVGVVIATGNAVVEQYRTYCKTDGEMIGAMAQTIVDQRNRLMLLERKVQELQNRCAARCEGNRLYPGKGRTT